MGKLDSCRSRRMISLIKENPEIHSFIWRLHKSKKSYQEIADDLEAKYGCKYSNVTIKNYIDRIYADLSDEVVTNPLAREKLSDVFLDTTEQMKKLNKKLWSLSEAIEGDPEKVNEAISIFKEIRQQVELQNKLLGKLQSGTRININKGSINYIDYAMSSAKYIEDLRKQGLIVMKKDLKGVQADKFDKVASQQKGYICRDVSYDSEGGINPENIELISEIESVAEEEEDIIDIPDEDIEVYGEEEPKTTFK
jgi:hypothetical protein